MSSNVTKAIMSFFLVIRLLMPVIIPPTVQCSSSTRFFSSSIASKEKSLALLLQSCFRRALSLSRGCPERYTPKASFSFRRSSALGNSSKSGKISSNSCLSSASSPKRSKRLICPAIWSFFPFCKSSKTSGSITSFSLLLPSRLSKAPAWIKDSMALRLMPL